MSMAHSVEVDASNFKTATIMEKEIILLEPQNKECCRYRMKLYAAISKWISEALGQPVAYFFDYRISDIWRPNNRGVYFILSDSYAFLPFLFDDEPYCIRQLEQ